MHEPTSHFYPKDLPISYESFQTIFDNATFSKYLESVSIVVNLPEKAQKKVLLSLAPHFKILSQHPGDKCFGDRYYRYFFSRKLRSSPCWYLREYGNDRYKTDPSVYRKTEKEGILSFVGHMLGESDLTKAFLYIDNVLNITKQPLADLKKRLFPDFFYISSPSEYLSNPMTTASWAFKAYKSGQGSTQPFRYIDEKHVTPHVSNQKNKIDITDLPFEREIEPKNCYLSVHKCREEVAYLFYTLFYDKNNDDACWVTFPPETNLVYQKYLIDQYQDKEILIFDDFTVMSNNMRRYPPEGVKTWIGHDSSYKNIDWSCLAKREVKYIFHISRKESVEKALYLHQCCEKHSASLTFIDHEKVNEPWYNRANDYTFRIPVFDKEHQISFACLTTLAESKYGILQDKKTVLPNQALSTKTSAQLKSTPSSVKYLIEPLFKTGEIVLIVAKQKTSKSLFALDLSMMLACGGSIGDRLSASTPRKVLYIDAEMPEEEIQHRIEMLKTSYDKFDNHREKLEFHFLRTQKKRLNLMNEDDQALLEQTLQKHSLLVLDNLGKLIPRQGEMSEQRWGYFLNGCAK